MKNSAKQTKKTNESVNVENKQEKQLTQINLSKFANELSGIDLKVKKEKETLYKYPETFTKEDINGEKGKRFRNGLRNRLKSITNNIFFYAKTQDADAIKKEIEKFDAFYLEHYRINDYTLHSVTNSKEQEKHVSLVLEIIKEVKAGN